VIKILLEIGETLTSRLLMIDALSMEFTELKVRKDPTCKLCGENPEVTELIDYDVFCGITAPQTIEERDQQPIMADD
jgi:adenylyltransferase/sulfurtransferase